MGSEKGHDLQCLLPSLLWWAPTEDNRAWLLTQPCSFGWQPEYYSRTWFHRRLTPQGPWICLFGRWSLLAECDRRVAFEPWELVRDSSRWKQQASKSSRMAGIGLAFLTSWPMSWCKNWSVSWSLALTSSNNTTNLADAASSPSSWEVAPIWKENILLSGYSCA